MVYTRLMAKRTTVFCRDNIKIRFLVMTEIRVKVWRKLKDQV